MKNKNQRACSSMEERRFPKPPNPGSSPGRPAPLEIPPFSEKVKQKTKK